MEVHFSKQQQEHLLQLVAKGSDTHDIEILQEALLLHKDNTAGESCDTDIPIATNGKKKQTLKQHTTSSNGKLRTKNALKSRERNNWAKISPLEVKKCYYSILDSYGTLQGKDLAYYAKKRQKDLSQWSHYLDSLIGADSQAISTTFMWFAGVHLQSEASRPIEITKMILHYYKANTQDKRIDLTVGYPTVSIVADIERFVRQYNEQKLYPDRIRKERKTAELLALLCAKQLSESESLLDHKDYKELKVYTSLEHLAKYLKVDKLILKSHLHKLSAVRFILRTDEIWKNKIVVYLNKNVFNKW